MTQAEAREYILELKVIDPPRGRPVGGGGVYRIGGMGASAPIS